jgi:hypothetical protein
MLQSGSKRKESDWRRMHNEGLYNVFCSVVKAKGMGWSKYVAHVAENQKYIGNFGRKTRMEGIFWETQA